MKRKKVYEAIDSERDYQDGVLETSERSIDEFILYIKGYSDKAVSQSVNFGGGKGKLEIIRKIAALCVHCGEQHGIRKR